jgi:hypothetical protein
MPALCSPVVETALCVSYHLLSCHLLPILLLWNHQLPSWLPVCQPYTIHPITALFMFLPTCTRGPSNTFLLAGQLFHPTNNWSDPAYIFPLCNLFWKFFLLHLTLDNEGNMFLRNIRNHLPSNTVSRPRKQESPITLAWKPQNSLSSFIQWTLELRTVWCSNNLKLEQKIWGKFGFETQTKTRKSNKESRGRILSPLGPDERRVIHLPVNSNIPPTIIIYWLLYNIFMYVLL